MDFCLLDGSGLSLLDRFSWAHELLGARRLLEKVANQMLSDWSVILPAGSYYRSVLAL